MNKEEKKNRIVQLLESSLSRIWQHVQDPDRKFAVISVGLPGLSDEETENRYQQLKNDVRSMGYGYIELRGAYKAADTGEMEYEPSLMIPEINRAEAIDLGDDYGQESVLHKNEENFVMVGCGNRGMSRGEIAVSFATGEEDSPNLSFAKEIIQNFFSSLKKGSHAGKKFVFQALEEFEGESLSRVWYGLRSKKPLQWTKIMENTENEVN